MKKTITILAAGLAAGSLLGFAAATLRGHDGGRGAGEPQERPEKEARGHGEEEHEGHGHAEEAEAGHDEHGHGAPGDEGPAPGRIPDSLLARAGIALDEARATDLPEILVLPGTVGIEPSRAAKVAARFPGLVTKVPVKAGDRVRAGDLVARLESDASLEPVELRAPRGGTVVRLEAAVGMAAESGQILAEIADLSVLRVELKATASDMARLRAGQPVEVRTRPEEPGRKARIARVAAAVDRATQMRTVSFELPDPRGELGEGLFVQGTVEVGRGAKGLSVPRASLQTKAGKTVVYVREGEFFEERVVATGRRSADRVEILSGLEAGEKVAAQGSFVVKADLGKGEAAHEH